jgi:thiosulfate dehydrogenase [quinone] large subunit
MLFLMYVAVLPPEHNPLVDEHIIYSLLLILLLFNRAGDYLGLGARWARVAGGNDWLR